MIDLRRAELIKKGIRSQGLRWLAEQAAGCQKIIELGSYHGRSARAMLDNSRAHLWCVDTWDWRHNASQWKVTEEDYEAFFWNIVDVSERITILKMTTQDAFEYFAEEELETFDMVFIDANHDYESVRAEILNYVLLLESGGLLCGHDYHNGREGVDRAVDELIGKVVHEEPDAIWWTRKGG